jgi:hypothetical protein
MQRPFLGPFAHLAFDGPRGDPVAPWLERFPGNLLCQPVVPAAMARAGRTLGRAAAQDFRGRGKRQPLRVQPPSGGGFVHQHPHRSEPAAGHKPPGPALAGVWPHRTGRFR